MVAKISGLVPNVRGRRPIVVPNARGGEPRSVAPGGRASWRVGLGDFRRRTFRGGVTKVVPKVGGELAKLSG